MSCRNVAHADVEGGCTKVRPGGPCQDFVIATDESVQKCNYSLMTVDRCPLIEATINLVTRWKRSGQIGISCHR